MRIRTLDQVNGRTADGRVYSAGQGAVTDVDDNDEGMVALMKDLVARGVAEIVKVKKSDDEAVTTAGISADDEAKALRTAAEKRGIKIDGRWSTDRLREELKAAEAGK